MSKKIELEWCMCVELDKVVKDMYATCSQCGGMDAYGTAKSRPKDKRKKLVNGVK